jgi:hypothetical protein
MIQGTQARIDPRLYFAVSRLFTSRLRVLVVTDGTNSLDDLAVAPLGRALGMDAPNRRSHLQFDVTTAHRASHAADHGFFRFDAHDLREYDQIWVWRTENAGGDPLSRSELQAISHFLEAGGSVYAARR